MIGRVVIIVVLLVVLAWLLGDMLRYRRGR